jgi:hypothetical protein
MFWVIAFVQHQRENDEGSTIKADLHPGNSILGARRKRCWSQAFPCNRFQPEEKRG